MPIATPDNIAAPIASERQGASLESALATAIPEALKAGRIDVVMMLARQLESLLQRKREA